MRFVHLKVPAGLGWRVRDFYENTVIPTLQSTEGCLFASLLQPTVESGENVSMTIWASRGHAEAYESSGAYDRLLDESDEAVEIATQWKANLSGDRVGGPPPLHDPEVEGFPIGNEGATEVLSGEPSQRMFLRIVALRVDPARMAELRERYEQEVEPELLETPGCRAAFLVDGVRTRRRALSVSIWDSEEHAVRYELSGRFEELVNRLSEFFSGLYQWKLALASGDGATASTGVDVSGYNIVTGSQLGGPGDSSGS
jgi:heme-degrading monooxygenase HmoA